MDIKTAARHLYTAFGAWDCDEESTLDGKITRENIKAAIKDSSNNPDKKVAQEYAEVGAFVLDHFETFARADPDSAKESIDATDVEKLVGL